MVRLITDAPCENDFILTVRCSVYEYPMKLWISLEDTVSDLKEFMGKRMECFSDEMTFMISLACPYPLPDDMRLCRLLDEHRHLILQIHEGKEECYGRTLPLENHVAWWGGDGNSMPDRYLFTNEEGKEGFDFRYLVKSQIPRIRSWIYSHRHVSEIWLLGTHPSVDSILYTLAEDILSFVSLDRIVIHHPEEASYSLPLFSEERHRVIHQDGVVSHLTRDSIVYLYQHLLLDQYRDSAEEVSLIIHGGLLHGHSETFRFSPSVTS